MCTQIHNICLQVSKPMCKYVHRSVNLVLGRDRDCELQRKQSLVMDEWEMAAQGFEAETQNPTAAAKAIAGR